MYIYICICMYTLYHTWHFKIREYIYIYIYIYIYKFKPETTSANPSKTPLSSLTIHK